MILLETIVCHKLGPEGSVLFEPAYELAEPSELDGSIQHALDGATVDITDLILNGGRKLANKAGRGELIRAAAPEQRRGGGARDGAGRDHGVDMVVEDGGGDGHTPDAADGADKVPAARGGGLVRLRDRRLEGGQLRVEQEARPQGRREHVAEPLARGRVLVEAREQAQPERAQRKSQQVNGLVPAPAAHGGSGGGGGGGGGHAQQGDGHHVDAGRRR